MLNIVIFGPPGAGKGTQAKKIIEEYSLIHLSTGELLRAERRRGTELGKKVQAVMDAGKYVSDEIVIAIIESRLDAAKDAKGFIFDGFPRTIPQAEALDRLLEERNQKISCTLRLRVSDAILTERLLKRAEKEGRSDDTREVIEERILEYNKKTLPVAAYYERQEKLYPVEGTGTVDEVFGRIKGVINTLELIAHGR